MLVFEAIKVTKKLNEKKVRAEIENGMKRYTKLVSKYFRTTTQTWKKSHQPKFNPHVRVSKKAITGTVSTTARIYRYVSEGTKRHYVRPRRAGSLAFPSGYTAKTSQGNIPARNGGSSGNTVFSRGHWVSGIKARKFDIQIRDDTADRFEQYMNFAIQNSVEGY